MRFQFLVGKLKTRDWLLGEVVDKVNGKICAK